MSDRDDLKDLKQAVQDLVKVAKALHTPLDTSTVEKAINAVLRNTPAEKSDDKPAEVKPAVAKVESK